MVFLLDNLFITKNLKNISWFNISNISYQSMLVFKCLLNAYSNLSRVIGSSLTLFPVAL